MSLQMDCTKFFQEHFTQHQWTMSRLENTERSVNIPTRSIKCTWVCCHTLLSSSRKKKRKRCQSDEVARFCFATVFLSIASKTKLRIKDQMSQRLYSFSPIMLWPTWCIGFSPESLCYTLCVGVLSKVLSIATLWEAKSSNLYINTTRIRLWSAVSPRSLPQSYWRYGSSKTGN